MKARAKSLIARIHLLQTALYNYGEDLRDISENAKSEKVREKYKSAQEHAVNAGFELDISTAEMVQAIKYLERKV